MDLFDISFKIGKLEIARRLLKVRWTNLWWLHNKRKINAANRQIESQPENLMEYFAENVSKEKIFGSTSNVLGIILWCGSQQIKSSQIRWMGCSP